MKPPDLSTLSHLWPTVGATSINRWRRVLSDITVRAPSGNHNNDDLLVWALHLLGGAERWVDVEELYLKAFELAPARLSWRTRPDLPDYKKCAKALQAVESPKGSNHHGLLAKNGSYERRLTIDGLRWCEEHQEQLSHLYLGGVVPSAAPQDDARRIRSLTNSDAFRLWTDTGELTCQLGELADAFRCLADSPMATWQARLSEHTLAAERNGNDKLTAFINAARCRVEHEVPSR